MRRSHRVLLPAVAAAVALAPLTGCMESFRGPSQGTTGGGDVPNCPPGTVVADLAPGLDEELGCVAPVCLEEGDDGVAGQPPGTAPPVDPEQAATGCPPGTPGAAGNASAEGPIGGSPGTPPLEP